MRSLQFDSDVCRLPSVRFTGPWGAPAAGGTGAADAILQPSAVGEGIPLVWRSSRG